MLEANGAIEQTIEVSTDAAGQRLDQFLAAQLDGVSRSRVQMLMEQGDVLVNGEREKASLKLRGGEHITITGEPRPVPLKATAEDIPLDVVYEDADLAVVNKPAGMMVHAGSGQNEDARSRGTLVNALLHRFKKLSATGGDLRPGIVHRLDKDTSGLIVVAKNDTTHRKLGDMFSDRRLRKSYLALVHGLIAEDTGTIQLPISRDVVRRIRMTTKRAGGRSAVSHWQVLERIGTAEKPGPFGNFTLVEVRIETGRTHQIRVHMQAIGHPVVGDFLYGAPHFIRPVVINARGLQATPATQHADSDSLSLDRNFLHAAELDFKHPRTGEDLSLHADLPPELTDFLNQLR
jgi:23S rRNA pseudouridine1911/1915/1917 synthase